MSGSGPDGEGHGVVGSDLTAVAEEIRRGLRVRHGQHAPGFGDAVADLTGRDLLQDPVDERPRRHRTASRIRGRGDCLRMSVGDCGRQGCLADRLGRISGKEGPNRRDAHGGPVAPGPGAIEQAGGQGPPVAALADQAEHPAGRRAVATIEVVPPSERCGKKILVDRTMDGQGEVTEQAISVSSVHCQGADGSDRADRWGRFAGMKNCDPSASPRESPRRLRPAR